MTDQQTVDRLTAALDARADLAARPAAPPEAAPAVPALVLPLTPLAGRPVRRHRARIAATVAVAAVAAAFAVAVPVALHHDTAPDTGSAGSSPVPVTTAPSSPVAVPPPVALGVADGRSRLAAAADRRAATGDVAVPAGHFLYAETLSAPTQVIGPDNKAIPSPAGSHTLDQSWAPADPTDTWTRYQVDVGTTSGADPLLLTGSCDNIYHSTQDAPADVDCAAGGRTALLPAYLQTPAASPQVLLDRLRAAVARDVNPEKVHDVDALVLIEVGSDLSGVVVPADLQAQLIRALALLPSAKVLTPVPTYTGRTGIAVQVSYTAGADLPSTDGIVLDPTTGRLIGQYSGTPGAKDFAPTDVAVSVVGSVVKGRQQLPHAG